MANESISIKLNIPGQEDQKIELPMKNQYPSEARRLTLSKKSTMRIGNYGSTRLWCVSSLHEDIRETDQDKSFIAISGGPFVYILQVADTVTHLQTYKETSLHVKEDFYTVAWGRTDDREILLAAGGFKGEITLINTQTAKVLYKLYGHRNEINELKFQPTNGAFLLSCSSDYSLRLWNVKSRVQIAIFYGLSGHIAPVLTIHWHHEETIVASGGMDSTVKLWHIQPLAEAIELSKSWDPQIENNTQGLPCAKNPFKTVMVRNSVYSTGKVHRSFVDCVRFFGDLVISKGQEGLIIVWKPDDLYSNDGVIVLFTIAYPQEFMEMKMRFSVNSESEVIAIGGARSDIFIYRLTWAEHNPLIVKFVIDHEAFVRGLGFTHNDKVIGVNDFGDILIATVCP